jgi:DNA-3-methyladenine glycosylase
MYFCVNITVGSVAGKPEAVLLRALEPVAGEEIMTKRRNAVHQRKVNLTNGPGRLCMAMNITKAQNLADVTMPPLYILDAPPIDPSDIVETTRIGVDYAEEWKNKPWRFYIRNNNYVSSKIAKSQFSRQKQP